MAGPESACLPTAQEGPEPILKLAPRAAFAPGQAVAVSGEGLWTCPSPRAAISGTAPNAGSPAGEASAKKRSVLLALDVEPSAAPLEARSDRHVGAAGLQPSRSAIAGSVRPGGGAFARFVR